MSLSKGKQRASSLDERSPLLPQPATSNEQSPSPSRPTSLRHGHGIADSDDNDSTTSHTSHAFSWSKLLRSLVIVLFAVAFLCLAVFHILVGHIVSDQFKDEQLAQKAQRAFLHSDPYDIRLLNTSADGSTFDISLTFDAGISVPKALNWDDGKSVGIWKKVERSFVEWGVRRAKEIQLDFDNPISILDPKSDKVLFTAMLPDPVSFKLLLNSNTNELRQQNQTVALHIVNPSLVAEMARASLHATSIAVIGHVDQVQASLGKDIRKSWLGSAVASIATTSVYNISQKVTVPVPKLPDLSDPSRFVDLQTFQFTTPQDTLEVSATATITNPVLSLLRHYNFFPKLPWELPFIISIAGEQKHQRVQLASVDLQPFRVPNERHFNVSIDGTVVESSNASNPVSTFISRYLDGYNNTVYVKYDQVRASHLKLPPILASLAQDISVPLTLPGADDTESLLQHVSIEDMQIHTNEAGTVIEVDGVVVGQLNLPAQFASLGASGAFNISQIWPDVLIHDGLSPPPSHNDLIYPPAPLPSNAFARLRTPNWVPASTSFDIAKNATIIRAHVKDVPVEIVRSDVFKRFLAKIVLGGGKEGVRAGVKGLANATVVVKGLGQIGLTKLPVRGDFMVGPQAPLTEEWY